MSSTGKTSFIPFSLRRQTPSSWAAGGCLWALCFARRRTKGHPEGLQTWPKGIRVFQDGDFPGRHLFQEHGDGEASLLGGVVEIHVSLLIRPNRFRHPK